jgi:hypothetical protein
LTYGSLGDRLLSDGRKEGALFAFFLWLHIMSAIIAFGPTFAYPIMGMMVAKQPQHALFVIKLQESVGMKLTYPFGLIVLPLAGIGMIWKLGGVSWFFGTHWLVVGVVLFLIAATYSVAVQTPTGMKLMRAMEKMPPGPPPEGSSGPPPEIAAMVKKLQVGGMFLTAMIILIMIVMVFGANGKLGT